jgi:hypothetical protein
MTNFQIKRFWKVFRYDLRVERSYLFRVFLCITFVLTLLMLISMGLGLTTGKDGLAAMSYMANFMVHSFFMAFMLFGASMLFRHLKTTQANISYLMLPGSNLEKFLSRYIYVTVVWLLVFFAAYVCADSLSMLFVSVMGGTAEWGLPKFLEVQRMAIVRMSDPAALDFHSLFSNSQSPYVPSPGVSYWTYLVNGFTQHTAIVSMGCLIVQLIITEVTRSLGLLCGSLFRRFCWVFGMFASYLVSPVLLFVNFRSGVALAVTGVVAGCFLVFCYVAAYRLFCRRQVITNQLINI